MDLSDDDKQVIKAYNKLMSSSKDKVFVEAFDKRLSELESNNKIDVQIRYLEDIDLSEYDFNTVSGRASFLSKLRKINKNVNSKFYLEVQSIKSFVSYYNEKKNKQKEETDSK